MSTLTLNLIRCAAELAALEGDWQALWERVPGASPFQSPHWLLPWWRIFGTEQPVVACVFEGERLCAVLPMYLLAHEQKLLPIGVGGSDYFDVLAEPQTAHRVIGDLLGTVLEAGREAGARVCDLTDVPTDAQLRALDLPWKDDTACPVLPLRHDAVPALQRRKLRMNRNRAERCGRWQVMEAADALPALLRLNHARWGANRPVHALLQDAAPRLLNAALARLAVFRDGSRIAAACLVLLDRSGRLYFYMSGFDAECAHFSPGSLLIGAMIEQAIREGQHEAHFLRGTEAYKYRWGAADRWNASCRITL